MLKAAEMVRSFREAAVVAFSSAPRKDKERSEISSVIVNAQPEGVDPQKATTPKHGGHARVVFERDNKKGKLLRLIQVIPYKFSRELSKQ
jgi:hypothetical protein